jgi:TFIIF-interacting CTD phosphatase-like protein
MTMKEKNIVKKFRNKCGKSFYHDSDDEVLEYLKTLKKMYPSINFYA